LAPSTTNVDRTVADALSSSSGQTSPVSSSVDQPIDYSPGLAIRKTASSVTDVSATIWSMPAT